MERTGKLLAALFIIGVAGSAIARDPGGDWWNQDDRVGSNPVVRTARESFAFSPTGHVEVRSISGSVEVVSGKGDAVEYAYERKAATEQDYNCSELKVEHDKESLRISAEHKKVPECRSVHATDKLTLTVPRGAGVSLQSVGDSVKATGLDGMLRLGSIGDSAVLKDVQQLRAESIGDTLRMEVSRLGPSGIEIDSVGDSVELTLPDAVDALLRIDSVGDEIRGPGLRVSSPRDGGFETILGKGGPNIYIDSVGDSVVIHGPTLKRERVVED